MIEVEIDAASGFCFGVIHAIKKAEQHLATQGALCCLGDIVHNGEEVLRLKKEGLQTISYQDLDKQRGGEVLFRAHGEPPLVYEQARKNGIRVVDATCPVVLKLQKKIKTRYQETQQEHAQIVIFGKPGHAEVNGLVGQTNGNAIVVQCVDDADKLVDYSRPVIVFSQTTMGRNEYQELVAHLRAKLLPSAYIEVNDTICRQVSNRAKDIGAFAESKDWVYFVAGKKSSNGKVLFQHCKEANPNTLFVSSAEDITEPLPKWVKSVGVCGATSTPRWQMEQVAEKIKALNP